MVSLSYNPILVVVLSLLYFGLTIGTVYFCIKATTADPSDPTIKMQKEIEARGEVFDSKDYDFECEICDTAVLDTTKHCGACNRCTNGFDHHCRWLNNCVGSANYMQFFKLIVLVFSTSVLHNLANFSVLVHLIKEHEPLVDMHQQFY